MKTLMQLLQAKGGEIHAIDPDARVYDALKLMAEKDVGALVVLEAGKLAGIISERDYARKVILQGKSSHDIPVREIMTGKVVTVQLDADRRGLHGAHDQPARAASAGDRWRTAGRACCRSATW